MVVCAAAHAWALRVRNRIGHMFWISIRRWILHTRLLICYKWIIQSSNKLRHLPTVLQGCSMIKESSICELWKEEKETKNSDKRTPYTVLVLSRKSLHMRAEQRSYKIKLLLQYMDLDEKKIDCIYSQIATNIWPHSVQLNQDLFLDQWLVARMPNLVTFCHEALLATRSSWFAHILETYQDFAFWGEHWYW